MTQVENSNFMVFLVPLADTPEGDSTFWAGTAESAEVSGDVQEILDVLPADWKQVKAHVYPIEKYVADLARLPNFVTDKTLLKTYDSEWVTHLALVESECRAADSMPFYFAGNVIKHNSAMLMWCGGKGKYRLMHCAQCADTFMHWLQEMQGEWYRAECQGLHTKAPTLN